MVVFIDPPIELDLRAREILEDPVGAELRAQAAVEPHTLPVVVGERGSVCRWVMPFSRQTRSKSTSTGGRVNRPVNTLPLSVKISSGTP